MFSTSINVHFMEIYAALSIMLQLFIFLSISVSGVFGLEPSFDVPIINVTVQEGATAVLPCSVDFLGDHKVAWTDQWNTLLTLDDRRIIDDSRISIERPYTRDWNLHIRKSEYNDRGQYTCQINTNPVKMKTVMLLVLVPSKIINELSSRDQSVREGATVTLVCNVTGVPLPEVTWFKVPDDETQAKEKIGTSGEVLIIHNVSRYCDGIYECMAYNSVDPAVTRQIKVFVEFPPEVRLNNKRIGQYVDRETILDCEIVAYPHGQMYWTKDGTDIDPGRKDKYQLELYSGNDDSKTKTLSLRVKNIQMFDFGSYTCVAKNYLGQDKETMYLYDYSIHNKHTTTTESTSPQSTLWPGSNQFPLNPIDDITVLKTDIDDFDNGRIDFTQHSNLQPIGGDPYNRGPNKPYKTGKALHDSHHGNRADIKEALSISCSGTFVTVCEGSAALGGVGGTAPSMLPVTFQIISSLITLRVLQTVL